MVMSIIEKSMEDEWFIRVTMDHGVAYIGRQFIPVGGYLEGFYHIAPLMPAWGREGDPRIGYMEADHWSFELPIHPSVIRVEVVWERGIDVSQRHVLLVEDGIS